MEKAKIKPFTLACLTQVEQLVAKYPHLEIGNFEAKPNGRQMPARAQIGRITRSRNSTGRSSGSLSGGNSTDNDSIRITRSSNRLSVVKTPITNGNQDNNGKNNTTKTVPKKITKSQIRNQVKPSTTDLPPTSTKTPSTTTAPSTTTTSTVSVTSTKTSTTNDAAKTTSSKPGTAGSKQALIPSRSNKANINGSNENKESSSNYFIDTKDHVDETITMSLSEFCQRTQLALPNDARELCKKFTILIPDLDLRHAETPPHADDDERLSSWKAQVSGSVN